MGAFSQKWENEHRRRIQHVRVSLNTKFDFKHTILSFLDQICPKGELPFNSKFSLFKLV